MMTVEGEGSSSHDQSVAIADQHNVLQSVVVESPPPQSQSRITNDGGESGEASGEARGESSNYTRPAHKIRRVPEMPRKKEEAHKYYHPQLVSIGPYHRNKTNLKSFEKIKIEFKSEYVRSCEPQHSENELYNKVAEVTGEARSRYAKGTTEDIDDTTFTKMMFHDGCFILQFIRWIVKNERTHMETMKSHDIALVQRDLFLLENQLPFKVLQALKSFSDFDDKLIDEFIENILRGTHLPQTSSVYDRSELLIHSEQTPDELGDLLEYTWVKNLYCGHHEYFSHGGRFPRHSARDLKMVGIRLRPYHIDLLSYIAFKSTWNGGILTLSKINIDDTTISLLMNMVAYEHCRNTCVPFFCATNYICFLDSIIDSANDVKELRHAGIISNCLGNDEEVVNVIHEMAAGLVPDCRNTCYLKVKLRIEEYHSHKGKTKIATWISEVMRDHFRSPWTAIAVLAALFALLLTAVHTYFAVFPRTDKCQESICNYLKNNTLQSNGG
ncbi:UPF0481 protein [Camellia lanceoleosa]|uniref:UPF0481 protein n=1 Tax=Camellia lanceoleosa TaxID=1840588 RepID=A0ACC0GD33_9ERIC|nr:UPF0481 protein [Camellia lanceoleosa]